MYRSWAYILMVAATLAGIVALLWPSPPVRTIEEIAMPARTAPVRPEPPPKPAKPASKPPAPPKHRAEAPAPPAVVGRMPAQNTTTRRGAALPQNGMQPNMFGKSGGGVLGRSAPAAAPPAKPAITPRPLAPPRASSEQPPREPAAR